MNNQLLKLLILLLTSALSVPSKANDLKQIKGYECEVQLKKIFLYQNLKYIKNVISSSTCEEKTQQHIIEKLTKVEGELNLNILFKDLEKVKFKPSKITISTLERYIKDALNLGIGFQLMQAKVSGNKFSYFSVKQKQKVLVECDRCLNTGKYNLKLSLLEDQLVVKNLWIKTEIGKKIKTYQLTQDVDRFNQEKLDQMVIPIEVVTSEPEKYYVETTDFLVNYRNSRPLKSGDLLLKSWLIPRDLIKNNKQVNVILINNGIQIKSKGIPTQSAGINQMVEIINPLTKKKFLGQVIGESLVKVEL